MNTDIIKSVENTEEGMVAIISRNHEAGFNVILIDADSNESLGGKIGIIDYDKAEVYANFVVNN